MFGHMRSHVITYVVTMPVALVALCVICVLVVMAILYSSFEQARA
jgi:hypothetical protein